MKLSLDNQVTTIGRFFDDPNPMGIPAWNIDITVIPEPSTLGLLGLGALALRRKKE